MAYVAESTSLAWNDKFEEEARIWDNLSKEDMEIRDRAFAAVQLALVEFLRKVAGRQHKAQAFLANLHAEAQALREAAESERRENKQRQEEEQEGEPAEDNDSASASLWSIGRRISQVAIQAVEALTTASPENNVANATPEVRLAMGCEALAQGLSAVITCMDLLEEGISTASNMKKAIQSGLQIRSALRSMRLLVETSECDAVREATSKLKFMPEARRRKDDSKAQRREDDSTPKRKSVTFDENPEVTEKECVEVDRKVEHLFLDMQRVFAGTFSLGARSATSQWLLRAIGLQADRDEGLGLLRSALQCQHQVFRLIALFSLSYQRLVESEEYLLLGFVSQATAANEEAWEVEKARRAGFPDSRDLGAQVGMRMAFDVMRTGSSRLESRLLFTPVERDAADGVCFNVGPDADLLEALGGDEAKRTCHYRLRLIWEVVLQQLRAWDLESLASFLPLVLEDASRFISTSEIARGCVRNGGILLAALEARNGRDEECDKLLDEVEQLQAKEELEGQFRTKLRIELLRARPKKPCVATVALIEEIYRYRLMPTMRSLEPLKESLTEVSEVIDDLPDSWVPFELDLAVQLWRGVIAKTEGQLKEAEKKLVDVIDLAEESEEDVRSIPCLYHLYLCWTELMCTRIEMGEFVSAKRCRKAAVNEMHKEVERTSSLAGSSSGWSGLGGWTNSLKKLFIPPVHPLHPNCPLYFWRLQNLLEAGQQELSRVEDAEDEEESADEGWFSESGDTVSDPDDLFSEEEDKEQSDEEDETKSF